MRTLIVFIVFVVISISEVLPAGRQESDPLSTDPFTFVRLKYRGHRSIWDIDWPASDRNFILQLREHTNIDVSPKEKIVDIASRELFEYSFAYMLEVSRLRSHIRGGRERARISFAWWVYLGR